MTLFVSLSLRPVRAADTFYTGTAGNWATTDWSLGVQPIGADRANVNNAETVTIATNVGTINSLRVGVNGNSTDGSGTIVIDGGQLTISDTGGTGADVRIGENTRTGTITLLNGGMLTADNAGSDGQIFLGTTGNGNGIVDVQNGTIVAERGFYVGGDSTATDRVNTTGTFTLGDGSGSGDSVLTTSGGNTEVGYGGMGTMTINADGVLNQNSNNLVIGQGTASDGTVIIDGGLLNIHAGGDVNVNSGAGVLTLNSGTINVRDLNQNSAVNANNSVFNFNGGNIVGRQVTNRDGIGTINYNGSQIALSNGNFDTDFLVIGTPAAGAAVTLNTVAVGSAAAAGDVEVTLAEITGGLTLGTGFDATLNINNGRFEAQGGVADGGNVATINVGTMGTVGDFLIGGNSGFSTSRIDNFNVGANGTLTAGYTALGINTILTTDADVTNGTIRDVATFFPTGNGSNGAVSRTDWVGGDAEWDTTGTNWNRGLPAGTTISTGTAFTILESTNPIVGTLSDGTSADWTLGQTANEVTLTAASDITSGPVRAFLAGGNVTRSTDLRIARDFGADANYLQIQTGTLTVGTPSTNAKLTIGTNSGAGDNNGTVFQNGGTVTVNGNLEFGVDGLAGDLGGTYDMRGGTLNVTGNVREISATTNSAQFLINGSAQVNVDGNILVQRFAVADSNVSSITANYTIDPGQSVTSTGTTAVANGGSARGTLLINDAASSLTAANMAVGSGNNSRGTLNLSAGTLTITQTSGDAFLFGSANVATTGISTINQSGGDFVMTTNATDFQVRSGTLTINLSGGTMNLNGGTDSDFEFKRTGATVDTGVATANFSGGTFVLGRNFDYGNGNAILNISGDHSFTVGNNLLLDGTDPGANGANQFNVSGADATINIGNNVTLGAGHSMTFTPSTAGLAPINVTGGAGTVDLSGELILDDAAFTAGTATGATATQTTWSTGNGTWSGSDAEWLTPTSRMINPDGAGVLQTNDRITAFNLAAGSSFSGTPTETLPADWNFDNTTDPLKGDFVYTGASVDSLPLHAVLDATANGGPLSITRGTDLNIAPVSGNDASAMTVNADVTLDITDGSLDGTGPNLILGSATELGNVTQNGGTVNVDGILGFGTGASSFGGIYTLNGGTLNVFGDIVEGGTGGIDTTVDNAQFYMNGGTFNFNGSTISTQSFRVGFDAGSDATASLTDKTLNNSGELRVGDAGTGELNVLGTTTINAATWFYIGSTAAGGDGTVNLGNGSDSPTINVATNDFVIGESGTGELNILSGTIDADGGIHVANQFGSNGTVVVGNGTSSPVINNSGGNFETANIGTGVVTWNSGTLNQTTNNLIVGQDARSNATFTLNDGLIDLENQLRMNRGTGVVVQNGGTMSVGTRLDMSNDVQTDIDMTYRINAGTLNVADRVIDDLVIGNTNNTSSVSRVEQNGGTINVARHIYAGNDATGILSVDDPSAVLNIGYNYSNSTVDLAAARLFVANADNGDGSQANLTRGSVNIGGGLWAGNAGATGSVTVGSVAGDDNDTTIRVGIAGTDGNAQTRVGLAGNGNFTIESGRYYQETQNFAIANNAAGTGSVIVNGGELNIGFDQPSMTNNGTSDLTFGDGNGSFTQNGGTVQVADRLIYSPADGSGTFNANGGTMTITNGIDMSTEAGGSAAFNIGGGTVNIGGDIDYGTGLGNDSISLTDGTLNFTQAGGGTITAHNARDSFTFSGGTLQNLGTFNGYDASTSPETGNVGTGPSDALLVGGIESAFGAGKVGNGISFDTNLANNEHVSFGDARFGNPRAFSVSIWFNRSQENNGTTTNHAVNNVLMAQSSSPVNDNFEIGTQGNNLELYIDTNATTNPSGETFAVDLSGIGSGIVNGQWHHVVVSYDGDAASDRLNIFFDGQAVTGYDKDAFSGVLQSADSTTAADSPFTLGLARPDGNNWGDFSGQLDEFAAWNTTISSSDVADLYNLGAGSNSASILGSAAIYAPLDNQLTGNLTMLSQTGGTLAPGLATGTDADQIGQSMINAGYEFTGGLWDIDLISNGSISNDSVDVNGTLTLGGTSTLGLTLLDWTNLSDSDVFIVADYDSLSGTFGSVDFTDLITRSGLDTWMVDYNFGGANQIAILVPEPSRALLLGFGITALFLRRRRH